ncbi:MAG: hypothetical protein M3O87_08325 [Candidatus Dormibacteraeota bacterium]|nr:hypothetical protein [Candidatus Dormibacteraeota bacterium]
MAQGPNVLLVGPAGHPGAQYTSIQAAINAALPGDWVLVAPGVYHEHGGPDAGVLIQKSGVHLRGMNRNQVIVDGTKFSALQRSGTAPAGSPACPRTDAAQDLGDPDGSDFTGANGILVKGSEGSGGSFVGNLADNVSVENLTVCNYLTGTHGGGNQIWWNGGDGTGLIGMHRLHGDYINATSTYFKTGDGPAAEYGIFTSNEDGPGVIDHSYASNQRDSSYYVGACRNCNVVLTHAHAENSALGLSSTNAGGNLQVINSEWNHNRTGLVSNAQNNDDSPSPEYGQCVAPSTPPTLAGISAGPNSCYVMFGNYIHDNNNHNVPGSGLTSVSAVGTGVELAATQHISVIGNLIVNQKAWGVVTHDFPDPGESGDAACQGGIGVGPNGTTLCTFFSLGNYVGFNTFANNGGFGNTGNGDVANQAAGVTKAPSDSVGSVPDPNCFAGNTDAGGFTADPPTLQSAPCPPGSFDTLNGTVQLVCATGALSLFAQGANVTCPVPASYGTADHTCGTVDSPGIPTGEEGSEVCFLPLSRTLDASINPTMPDPCAGVPANAYCPAAATVSQPVLPNSAAAGSLMLPAIAGGLGAIGLGALVVGRRRRRATSGG